MVLALALFSLTASAQGIEAELGSLRRDFEFGKFDEVFQRAQARVDQGGVTEPRELAELHQLAGVSAFNLGRPKDAERHLAAVLRIDPEFALDPFVYPPATINFLERIRRELGPELEGIRQERRLEAARRRAAAEAAERERLRAEEQRRRIEAMSRTVTVRTVERRSMFVNFVPFGAGQFQQNRTSMGILLASLQGALAAVSIVGYWAHESLYVCKNYTIPDVVIPSNPYTVRVCAIPNEAEPQAQAWRIIRNVSGLGFYGAYAFGVWDAVRNHKDVVTTESIEQVPAEAPGPAGSLHLSPIPGGAAFGLTLQF